MLHGLDRDQRLQLMKFVCAFAWADLSLHPEERAFVERLVSRLGFDADEEEQVKVWLASPPPAESVDPTAIPREHKRVFLAAIDGVIAADGVIAPEERESVKLLKELLD
ncbi:MAG: TerB family tellurite resistance protein [Myxococcota bacterium]